jgi:hypothetical protein
LRNTIQPRREKVAPQFCRVSDIIVTAPRNRANYPKIKIKLAAIASAFAATVAQMIICVALLR